MNFILLVIVTALFLQKVSAFHVRENHHHKRLTWDPTKHPNWYLVNSNICGETESESRIIGGSDAELGEFPWLVQIFTAPRGVAPSFDCGGSIINSKYVITAGHCFSEYVTVSFIRAGEFNTETNPDCDDYSSVCAPYVRDYQAEKIIRHENFGVPEYLYNDISLVRIKGVFEFNDFVRPICLPYGFHLEKQYLPGKVIQVAGWGADKQIKAPTGIINQPAGILQKLKMSIVDNFMCSIAIKLRILDNQFCAGGNEGFDACAGDSGGPVMQLMSGTDKIYRFFLVGIVSYGPTLCAQKGIPGVYTRVDKYLQWILDNIQN